MRKVRAKMLRKLTQQGLKKGLVAPKGFAQAYRRVKSAWTRSPIFRALAKRANEN